MTSSCVPRALVLAACCAYSLAQTVTAAAQAPGRIPPPQQVALTTKDGVQLKITYYPSNAGQNAVPIVMLHDFSETRAVFDPLAKALQNPRPPESPTAPRVASRAVVTVDLRGHGGSKTALAPDGSALELNAARFELEDFQAMVAFDMEAVRSFLVEQNDAGMLNLNSLGVVGSGMGANVAVMWAARDWATPPLAARKQGQDVKALVLLSPRWNYRGLELRDAMQFPPVQQELSVLLAYGRADRQITKDCENIRKIFARYHPEPPADLVQTQKDFFVYEPDTALQGTKLLNSREFGMGPRIASFFEARLGSREFPWIQRKKP
ncbi:MAG: alpha/beta fold hydrolase [Pirellulales bacterium]|nr:alpha/beta fold hydrolase [Pirellulales bacterium]